jgi:hypothetical protein
VLDLESPPPTVDVELLGNGTMMATYVIKAQ